MIGEDAAVVIEALETHHCTGFLNVKLPGNDTVPIPVTHAKILVGTTMSSVATLIAWAS